MDEACESNHSRKCEDAYRKCLIETLHRLDRPITLGMSPRKRKGLIFLSPWEGLTFSRVHLRGVVISCGAMGTAGLQITVDDGSGRIVGVVWSKTDEITIQPGCLYNKYVSVRGQLTGFRSELQVRIDEINVVATSEEATEESLWWLEVFDEWESLATRELKGECPCLCHIRTGVQCKAMGSESAWSDSFLRAVAVVSSTLRIAASSSSGLKTPIRTSLNDILDMAKTSAQESASLQHRECFIKCAVIQAVRDLIQKGFVRKEGEILFLYSEAAERETLKASFSEEPRYPPTPAVEASQETAKTRSVPKFIGLV